VVNVAKKQGKKLRPNTRVDIRAHMTLDVNPKP